MIQQKYLTPLAFTICLLLGWQSVLAQNYSGKYKKAIYKCPIHCTSEGILTTQEGKKIQIASYVPLNDGDYIEVSEHRWGKKLCEEQSFKVYYIYEGTVSQNDGAKPHQMSPNAKNAAIKNNTTYIVEPTFPTDVETTTLSSTGSNVSVLDAEAALKFHNKARADVGVAPLIWSVSLSEYAQEWANRLANEQQCQLIHRSKLNQKILQVGENIAKHRKSNQPATYASEMWYKEISDFEYVPFNFNAGYHYAHYTQMIWYNTTEVGIGIAQCADGSYIIVANYNPPGNYGNQYPY